MHHYFSWRSGWGKHSLVFRGVGLIWGESPRSHFSRYRSSTKNQMELGMASLSLLIRVGNCMLLKFKRSLHTSILASRLNSLDNDWSTDFIRLMLILIWPPAFCTLFRVLGPFDQVSKLRLILWCPNLLLNHHQVCDYLILGSWWPTELAFHRFYPVLRVFSLLRVNALQILTVCTTSSLMFKIGTNNLSCRLQRLFE